MSDEKPQIKIPDSGPVSPSPFEKRTEEKFRNIDTLLYAVVVATVITAISGLISVGAIIIDQLHFNNSTYRDLCVSKIENAKLAEKTADLERRMNDQNQRITIDLQKTIKELLRKK